MPVAHESYYSYCHGTTTLHHSSFYKPRRDPAKWEGIPKQDSNESAALPSSPRISTIDEHSIHNSGRREDWTAEHPSPKYSLLPNPVADNISFDPDHDTPPTYSREASLRAPSVSSGRRRSQRSHSSRSQVSYDNAENDFDQRRSYSSREHTSSSDSVPRVVRTTVSSTSPSIGDPVVRVQSIHTARSSYRSRHTREMSITNSMIVDGGEETNPLESLFEDDSAKSDSTRH
ncbi:hypothetical protein C8Q75DRAFT_288829 [Abortiporus biennis]|nr:hypothetical protein C8Q75DRAFT_288829 [Abortiporus biennis]